MTVGLTSGPVRLARRVTIYPTKMVYDPQMAALTACAATSLQQLYGQWGCTSHWMIDASNRRHDHLDQGASEASQAQPTEIHQSSPSRDRMMMPSRELHAFGGWMQAFREGDVRTPAPVGKC